MEIQGENFTPNQQPILESEKSNTKFIIVIAIIVVIVAITAGVFGYLFAKKASTPVAQPVVTQPVMQVPIAQPVVQPEAESVEQIMPSGKMVGWKNVTGKYFDLKAPGDWEEQCPAGGCVLNTDISKSTTDDYIILGSKDGKQSFVIRPIYTKDTSNPEGKDLMQLEIDLRNTDSNGKDKQYMKENMQIGNNIFEKVTIPNSITTIPNSNEVIGGGVTNLYFLRLKNDVGIIDFESEGEIDIDVLINILGSIVIH